MSGVNKAKKIHGSESGYPAKISLTLPRTLAYEIVSEARHSRRSAEVIMQKLEQLFFDSVEGSRLPFFPAAIDPQLQRYVRLFRPIEPPAQSSKPRKSGQAFLDRIAKGRLIEQPPLPESPKAETAFMGKIRYRLRKKIRPVLAHILNQTRLPLLGFFVIVGRQFPASVGMLTEYNGKFYQIAPTGDAHLIPTRPLKHKNDVPDRPREDMAAPSGASVCVGYTAYAVSENHVIFGPHWQVRKELRQLLKTPGTAPTLAFSIRQHLEELAPQLLLARAYAKGRDYVKASQLVQEQVAAHSLKQQQRQAASPRPTRTFELVTIPTGGGYPAKPTSPALKPKTRQKVGDTQRLSVAAGS